MKREDQYRLNVGISQIFSRCDNTPTRLQLYGHLPPITKTIQVRRTRHAGHCWRSKDELISDVLLWTPTHGCARVGRPARTYIQQLCEDTGCNPEDLPEAMNDREKWRETVRDIRAGGATWWWFQLSCIIRKRLPATQVQSIINYAHGNLAFRERSYRGDNLKATQQR